MFRSFSSRDRAGKSVKPTKIKKSYSEHQKKKLQQKLDTPPVGSPLTSPIITLVIGREGRLFAAHEDQLTLSPFFAAALKGQFFESGGKRVVLPDEEPEIFSCILEYLYKGDYTPRLLHNKRRNTWELESDMQDPSNNGGRASVKSTIYHSGVGGDLLRDTAIYCAADKFGLDELKRLALRKQGLQSGIHVEVILRSARYAYDNTPDTDSHLRAHYLALIIRCRKLFKRSGRMEREMEIGGSKL
ncbi:MAG: hypothetical protein Q9163_002625 [Psora crenata]